MCCSNSIISLRQFSLTKLTKSLTHMSYKISQRACIETNEKCFIRE